MDAFVLPEGEKNCPAHEPGTYESRFPPLTLFDRGTHKIDTVCFIGLEKSLELSHINQVIGIGSCMKPAKGKPDLQELTCVFGEEQE